MLRRYRSFVLRDFAKAESVIEGCYLSIPDLLQGSTVFAVNNNANALHFSFFFTGVSARGMHKRFIKDVLGRSSMRGGSVVRYVSSGRGAWISP
jgi:hypothetical protein